MDPLTQLKRQSDWSTPENLDAIKERNNCKVNGDLNQYRILRNKVSNLIVNSKCIIYQYEIEEKKTINSLDVIKKIWYFQQGSENISYNKT